MDDAHDPYSTKSDTNGGNMCVDNLETRSNGQRNQVTPPLYIAETEKSTCGIMKLQSR